MTNSVQARVGDYYHLYMSRGGMLLKEFIVQLTHNGNDMALSSILKDDFVLRAHQQTANNVDLVSGEYLLTMVVRNGINKTFDVVVNRIADEYKINDGYLEFRLKPIVVNGSVEKINGWYSPFADPDRKSLVLFKKRIVDKFGAYRGSVQKGHKHAGIDIRGDWEETVYPVAKGRVIFKSHWRLNATIVIQHRLKDGNFIYSKYTHLKDIRVNLHDSVTEKHPLGRLFNKTEFSTSRYKHNHVHLEIRKSYRDKGRASSYSMTMKALRMFCLDPLKFMTHGFNQVALTK